MENSFDMRVTKRNGQLVDIAFDKILNRIKKLGQEANIHINYSSLAMKVIDQLFDKIETTKIDELAAEQCASLSTQNPDYGTLASRIVISNHQKNTTPLFSNVIVILYNFENIQKQNVPLISQKLWEYVKKYSNELNEMIDHNRDYLIDYFGFKTLERAYLFRVNNIIIERIQHMWMRVAVGIHGDINNSNSLELVKETYDLMSQKYFTHATPTLFNAGTPRPQLSSCYLIAMEDDSIEGIYNTLKDCAQISKYSGGIGLHIHNIRAKDSHIQGTNGKTDGIVPMLRVFNSTARYVNQSGKRNGSFAIYLEPWHADIEDFLELKKNHGDEELKARDLFYSLWMSDLFMERIKDNSKWHLFCPHECPGLSDVYGEKFKILYEKYESEGKARKIINARDLWFKILDAQMETGTPYLLFKDAANKKSNQQNLGTIKSSNLCAEIIQYSDDKETAVCNLASIALPSFVNEETKQFNYDKLHEVTKVVTNNLNKVIDINFYPTEKTKLSNMRNRPIGIGVQGLADTFVLMDISFHSDEAKKINKLIFETMYHAALEKSNEIAIERYKKITSKSYNSIKIYKDSYLNEYELSSFKPHCHKSQEELISNYCLGSYSSFIGSPASQGILQFDMWNVTPSDRYNWSSLKYSIIKYGLRNSLLISPMPTASTSQILGFNECFEPFTSNLYSRRTLAGEFVVVNKYLMKELINLGLWNEKIKNNIVANKGSVQQLDMLPEHIKNKYKIVWEIPMKHIIDMSADRGAFICQSQSLNLWVEDPTYNTLTSMHFYSWKQGLKTGIYYLRRKAKHQAQQFTIEPEAKEKNEEQDEICDMCSA
jgi:ribonucleoside-diphosphate reductase alpha subunit